MLLDADEQSAQDIQRFLKVSAYTFTVSHASDIPETLNYLKSRKPDIVLTDAAIAGRRDFDSVRLILDKHKIPAILLSDTGGNEIREQARQAGANDYLVKNKINLFNLQKVIVNTLKIREAENKLNTVSEKHLTNQESFVQMLNKISEGVMVINRENIIQYANAKAYNILSESSFRSRIAEHITYRDLESEERVELSGRRNYNVCIRISDMNWNGERVNLFILEKTEARKQVEPEVTALENLTNILKGVNVNLLLLKGGTIAYATDFAAQTFSLKPDELRRKPLSDLIDLKEDAANTNTVQSLMAEHEAKGFIHMPDGSMKEVNYNLRRLNLENEVMQLLAFEVVEHKPDYDLPKEREGNQNFSTDGVLHLASHDLREPVRTILNYIQLIGDQLRDGKYDKAEEYADVAHAEASRMDKLLSDLKVYIGLNEHNFSLSKVSMKLVATDVLKVLKPAITATGAEINVAELPDVSADRELVEKLLLQLVDNAIRFHKKKKKAVVDIGFDKFEGNIIFCVRDNGIGISKKYQDKIFDLFERLNRVDEYPGNGLGLAISKKIIDMHNGKIWVESLPGFGSSFYFSLSAK